MATPIESKNNLEDIAPETVPVLTWDESIILNATLSKAGGGFSPVGGDSIQSPNFQEGSKGWRLKSNGDFEGNSGVFRGDVTVGSLDVPDTTTSDSFHVDADGNSWWGANVADGIGSAAASVTKAGLGTFSNIVITGGSVTGVPISGIPNNATTDISLLDLSHDLVFSVTDADTIAWAGGTITMSNGRTFSIDGGNTGNMAAFTYIYLDPVTSATVLQVTTTAATAIGADKRIIGTAQNETTTASFIPFGPGKPLIDGDNIGAASVVAANMAANSIVAGSINVTDLAAINADMGSITAGDIVIPSGGFIRSGQTAFDTGTGFYLGNDSGVPKFSIGDSTGNKFSWDNVDLIAGDYFSVGAGSISDSPYHNFTIPWQNPADTTTDYWSNTGPIISTFGDYAAVAVAIANGTTATPLHSLFFATTFAKNIIVKFHLIYNTDGTPSNNGSEGTFLGLLDDTNFATPSIDNPGAGDMLGLYVDNGDGKIYFRSSDGGTETNSEVTGITITNSNTYRIEFIAGSQARLHINGTLKATITTNLPNSATQVSFGFGCKNTTDTYYVKNITAPEISIEK